MKHGRALIEIRPTFEVEAATLRIIFSNFDHVCNLKVVTVVVTAVTAAAAQHLITLLINDPSLKRIPHVHVDCFQSVLKGICLSVMVTGFIDCVFYFFFFISLLLSLIL